MPSSSRPIFTRVFCNSCYKNNKGFPKIRKATTLKLKRKYCLKPARGGHRMLSEGTSDGVQQNVTIALDESVNCGNSKKFAHINTKIEDVVSTHECILSDSVNMVDNTNGVDRTGSLQNACPLLRPAHFGFVKLGVSSRYRLADFSHKLPASSFSD